MYNNHFEAKLKNMPGIFSEKKKNFLPDTASGLNNGSIVMSSEVETSLQRKNG
jgi:hypothetical protein